MDRYEEALERAKAGKPMDEVFPELKESEDERIRKALIHLISEQDGILTAINGISVKDILAWLEKQKEQKHNIELIQRSWYMEGYHDREFGREPKWVIKTGKGGPKYGKNEKYGQPLEQKPVKLNDDTKVGLDRALQIVKDAKGNLCGYQSDDGIYECDHAIQTLERILKNGIEQKPVKWNDTDMKEARDNLISVCRDWERGEQTTLLPIVAVRARYFLEHLAEPKPAEWSEEDEKMLRTIISDGSRGVELDSKQIDFLKSLRPQPHWKPSEQ